MFWDIGLFFIYELRSLKGQIRAPLSSYQVWFSEISNTFSGQESCLFIELLDILFEQLSSIYVGWGVEIRVDQH